MGTANVRTTAMTDIELLSRLAAASLSGQRAAGETQRVAKRCGYVTKPVSSEKVAKLAFEDAKALAELLNEETK